MKALPLPHSLEAERSLLSCILQSPDLMRHLKGERPDLFYDLRHSNLFQVLREMYAQRQLIDLVTLCDELKKRRLIRNCGGLDYVSALTDAAPSPANFPYYLTILREKYAQRQLISVARDAAQRACEPDANVRKLIIGFQASLDLVRRLDGKAETPALRVWRPNELIQHEISADLSLVGDSEIFMGYTTVLAGPGSAGKSLCTTTLALAGAIGSGTWMGRRVHRRFRTLILQAENGPARLKREIEAIKRNHPEVDFDDWIFFSEPPDGGLPFHRADFRAAVREECDRLRPDLVVVDPWSQVAVEDASKEVIDKVNEIRSCIRHSGREPALLIVAHTKKPRPEDVRKGRGLVYLVSGSIALTNCARCCYVLLPWSDEVEDQRVYFCCPKLNDGENYPPTVWKRRFGTFFEHDPDTDPRQWGRSEDDDPRRRITEDQLRDAFGRDEALHARVLVQRLVKLTGCGESTAYKAVAEGGYLAAHLLRNGNGKIKLRESARMA